MTTDRLGITCCFYRAVLYGHLKNLPVDSLLGESDPNGQLRRLFNRICDFRFHLN